jgi:hypothetical protein
MNAAMRNLTRLAFLSVVAASSLAFAQEGEGGGGGGMRRSGYLLDASPQQRDMRLAIHAVLPYGYFGFGGFPFGVGATFYIPLVKDGFIPPLNDEFGIDFGADVVLFFGRVSPFALWIPVSVLWTFHFTDKFALYAKAGVALRIWPGYINAVFPDFTTAVGLNFMISKGFGLRAEAGYPGIKLGILLNF